MMEDELQVLALGLGKHNMPSSPAPPQYLRDLHEWPDFEVDDFDKPWKAFQLFLEACGYALYGSEEYHKRSVSGCCPTKAAKDPFHPADDEDFIHRTKWTQEFLLRGGYCQMKSSMYLAADCCYRNVFLEVVSTESPTFRILHMLSRSPLRADPRNHTIPCVKFIPAGRWTFISQACWGDTWNWPFFDSMNTRFEMARQLIEGVAFMHENRIGHGAENQDIHTGNILFNHCNTRPIGTGSSGELDTPIVPFHSTFDFRMAFIDFECAVHFERGIEPLIHSPNVVPPSHTVAPEQLKEGEERYDMFSADVFNLGRTLQIEIQKARVKKHRAVTSACEKVRQYDSLLDLMTNEIPSERPTAATAYQLLMAII